MDRHRDTTMGGTESQFPPTGWTWLMDPHHRDHAYHRLAQRYWKPLYLYLRSHGLPDDRAKDILQGFFTEQVLEGGLLDKIDRTRGRFRNFMRVALWNYAVNVLRGTQQTVALSDDAEPADPRMNPQKVFEKACANEVLLEALRELRLECERGGRQAHWRLFCEWFLDSRAADQRMDEIGPRHGIESRSQAYNIIAYMKKRFGCLLRSQIRLEVQTPAELNEELSHLIGLFSQE